MLTLLKAVTLLLVLYVITICCTTTDRVLNCSRKINIKEMSVN